MYRPGLPPCGRIITNMNDALTMWILTTNICGWIKLIHISLPLSDSAIRPPCGRIISKVGDVDAIVLDVDVDG